jgi:hypothetical protein
MNLSPKVANILLCDLCDYKCCKSSDYNKHLLTAKHKNRTKLYDLEQKVAEEKNIFSCKNCNKTYKARNSLWYHQKKCISNENSNDNNKIISNLENNNDNTNENHLPDKDLILMLMNDNKELRNLLLEQSNDFKNMMREIVKNGTHNTINNNCNNNNQTFNLQVFLNETCKDAMNITDFIESINLQLSDLESVGQLGYVKGISNIILKKLKSLDVTQRPVHCSDAKREILYVKDNNVWEKEDSENNKLKKAVKYISHKNILLLSKWREKYPDCILYNSPKNDIYTTMSLEAMGGDGNNEEKERKIIKNIAREVIIQK